jgi:hypothetical protein
MTVSPIHTLCRSCNYHHRCRRRRWQNSPFWAIASLQNSARFVYSTLCRESDHPVLASSNFATIIFLHSKVVSIASNPQPGEPGSCIYVLKWQGDPVIFQSNRFPFHYILSHTGLWWTYPNPPPHGNIITITQLKSSACLLVVARQRPLTIQLKTDC